MSWHTPAVRVVKQGLRRLCVCRASGAFINYPADGIGTLETNKATECKDRRRLMDRTRALHGGVDDGDGNDDPLCIGASGGDRRLDATSPEDPTKQLRELHVSRNNLTRFSQWIGVETASTFSVLTIFLGVGSKGSVHIQSPDPTTWPLADPNIFGGSHDIEYTCGMVQVSGLIRTQKSESRSIGGPCGCQHTHAWLGSCMSSAVPNAALRQAAGGRQPRDGAHQPHSGRARRSRKGCVSHTFQRTSERSQAGGTCG